MSLKGQKVRNADLDSVQITQLKQKCLEVRGECFSLGYLQFFRLMQQGSFHFNDKQRELIFQMTVADMIELFSLHNRNVANFLSALHKQPQWLWIDAQVFALTDLHGRFQIGIHGGELCFLREKTWQTLPENYRLLGIYLSEHLAKNPFLFLQKPEKKKPKITIEQLFFEMSLSQIGRTSLQDILVAEIVPPRKELVLRQALEKRKNKRRYTVGEIFTKMSLSRVGNLSLAEFFGAEVFGKK